MVRKRKQGAKGSPSRARETLRLRGEVFRLKKHIAELEADIQDLEKRNKTQIEMIEALEGDLEETERQRAYYYDLILQALINDKRITREKLLGDDNDL